MSVDIVTLTHVNGLCTARTVVRGIGPCTGLGEGKYTNIVWGSVAGYRLRMCRSFVGVEPAPTIVNLTSSPVQADMTGAPEVMLLNTAYPLIQSLPGVGRWTYNPEGYVCQWAAGGISLFLAIGPGVSWTAHWEVEYDVVGKPEC
jgi:hypothetical protein